VLARTLLVLLLLPQLGMLWVLNRPSPTTIPAGLVEFALEAALERTTAEVERATVDDRGVLRLQGLRLRFPEERGLDGSVARGLEVVQADLDATIVPAWRDWLRLRSAPPAIRAQGRVSADALDRAQPLLDRFDLRMDGGSGAVAVARAGAFHLRAEARGTPGMAGAGGEGDRALEALAAALAELRNFEGGAELVASANGLRLQASGRMREGASLRNLSLGGWEFPAGALDFNLDAEQAGERGRLRLRARDLRLGTARVATAALALDGAGLRLVVDGLDFAGIGGGGGVFEGEAQAMSGRTEAWKVTATVAGELGASRLAGRLSLSETQAQLTRLNLSAPAGDLVRLPGLGEFLRGAGVDFAGRIELTDAQALVSRGKLVGASGGFAATQAGWGDIRPSSIRPERPSAALSGRWSVDGERGAFRLEDLDLAGLTGTIGGGLGKDEPYEVRLRSTTGNPVHPGCLNSLLGGWWVDLWKRFDLTTTPTAPHADVLVRGRWGRAEAERVEVAAALENFGFMGARFASTRVWVEAVPGETRVRIEELAGLLDGKPAGVARGLVRWDWRNPAWAGQPEILAEGDLEPACALRLHDAAQAQRLRGWSFGLPWTKVRITPGGATEVDLVTGEKSQLGGVELGPMRLRIALPPEAGDLADVRLEAAFAGGRLEVDLRGNLADRNEVSRLALTEVWWADLQRAVPALLGQPSPEARANPASLNGSFKGRVDFGDLTGAEGAGDFVLRDPRLKTVHLLGGISQALGRVGVDFSSYPLTEARGQFILGRGKAELRPLLLLGEDALMELKGDVGLADGALNLNGQFRLRKSPFGVLGFINPNRFISKILSVKISGTTASPKAEVGIRDL
jgi:hypothetical protein